MPEPVRTDAKVFAMIEDMGLNALLDVLGFPENADECDTDHWRSIVRDGYTAGQISGDEIVCAWSDESGVALEDEGD